MAAVMAVHGGAVPVLGGGEPGPDGDGALDNLTLVLVCPDRCRSLRTARRPTHRGDVPLDRAWFVGRRRPQKPPPRPRRSPHPPPLVLHASDDDGLPPLRPSRTLGGGGGLLSTRLAVSCGTMLSEAWPAFVAIDFGNRESRDGAAGRVRLRVRHATLARGGPANDEPRTGLRLIGLRSRRRDQ